MDIVKTFGKWLYSFNNQAVMWADPDVAGYLDKRGGNFATWKSRFFILQGSTLFYFPNPFTIKNPLGVLPMEGSGLEVASMEEGGPQHKWCFRIKLAAQFGMAKRSVYFFGAPSKQAQEEWLENLKYAATTRSDLIDYLNKTRRVGADLRFKLSKSPAHLRLIDESRAGPESFTLQAEIRRLRKQFISLDKQASEIKSQCEQVETNVMLSLAAWDLFARVLADKNESDYTDKLQTELNLTTELIQLLATKANYMQGHRLELLEEDSRIELEKICEDALTKIQEYQAKIRIKAPRYTTEVDPHIFTENDEQFKHTSDIFIICSKVTANKKLLALQRRGARDTEKEARHGWLMSEIRSVKSVASDAAKAAVRNIAAEFSKDASNVDKFIAAEASTASEFAGKKTAAVNSSRGEALHASAAAAKRKARQLAMEFNKDMENLKAFSLDEEMQVVNTPTIGKSKAAMPVAKSTSFKQEENVPRTEGASLGWNALNKMKLRRLKVQGVKLKSSLISSLIRCPERTKANPTEGFRFNPKYLSMLKPRPRSANASVYASDYWVSASASGANDTPSPSSSRSGIARTPQTISTQEEGPQQFRRDYGTSGSGSSGFVSEDDGSGDTFLDAEAASGAKQIGQASKDKFGSLMFFDDEEDTGPELRKRSKHARDVAATDSDASKLRQSHFNHLSNDDFPTRLFDDSA